MVQRTNIAVFQDPSPELSHGRELLPMVEARWKEVEPGSLLANDATEGLLHALLILFLSLLVYASDVLSVQSIFLQ